MFAGLNLSLLPGTLLQITGSNGAGKTSLLRILCGLSPPSQGEVRWRGEPIAKLRGEFLAEVAYIGHQHGVKGDLTARENLRLAFSLGEGNMKTSLDDVLARARLDDFSDVPTRTLSLGQKKRVALARLLVTSAQLWLLDEPLAALDIQGIGLVETILSEHLVRGGMAVVSTHQPLALSQGQITQLDLG